MAGEPKADGTVHPSIAAVIAVVRNLETRLSISEDPTQFLRVLEFGAAIGNEDRKPPAR
jgi:hypothetical protein